MSILSESLEEIARKYDTDKFESSVYIHRYERFFSALRSKPVRLLELGVHRGGSLMMWRDYFPAGLIVGLDIEESPFTLIPDRIRFYRGSQDNPELLRKVALECAPEGFDIIIDDASHLGIPSRTSFQVLFPEHLKPGGIYVVEDWGTGYWKEWHDGESYRPPATEPSVGAHDSSTRNGPDTPVLSNGKEGAPDFDPAFAVHNFGMVGMVKELVDEVAWADITHPVRGVDLPSHNASIAEIVIGFGQVFVSKVS